MTFKLGSNTSACPTLEPRPSDADSTLSRGLARISMVDGSIRVTEPAQAWYWTAEWQAGEREAAEDIRLGRTTRFANADDFLASFER